MFSWLRIWRTSDSIAPKPLGFSFSSSMIVAVRQSLEITVSRYTGLALIAAFSSSICAVLDGN
ncbi:hypothetical protein D3C80_2128070 [compost metagenome]